MESRVPGLGGCWFGCRHSGVALTPDRAERAAPAFPWSLPTTGPHRRLSWLRAGVLGAHDGIVATSGLVIGVAAAGASHAVLLTSGFAGVTAGAASMAVAEFVSVSTQRDVARVPPTSDVSLVAEWTDGTDVPLRNPAAPDLANELGTGPSAGGEDLGSSDHLGVPDSDDKTLFDPWQAAAASMLSYICGSVLPLLMIVFVTGPARIPSVVAAASLALVATGWISARLGHVRRGVTIVRNVITGLIAMAITFGVGTFVGQLIG